MAMNSGVLKNRAMGVMSGFSSGQRTVVGIAIVMLVVGGVLFAQWASKPTMVPLYSNLSASDAGDITSKLSSSGVKYQLTDGGGTIMVPQAKVYQTRLDMASAGLPSGGSVGYKLLDKQGITTSDFKQHVDYQRALEGELANTISSIQGVDAATVHLVIPQQDVFADDSKKPTASVLVKLSTGKSLSGQQVQSVVNLVASGVEGLSADNVTVSDDKGRLLASPGQSVAGGDDQQRAQTASLENDISSKIQALLQPVVGQGKVVVATRAEMNWDKKSTTSEIFNPDNKPAQASASQSTTESYVNGAPSSSTGCLGVGTPANQVCTPPAGSAAAGSSYTKTDAKQDNKLDHTVTQTETTPGGVNRISVAVMYDSSVANVDQTQIESLATQAAGLQPARGDAITVSAMPFDKTAADAAAKDLKAAEKAQGTQQVVGFAKIGATVLMVLVALVILFLVSKRASANYNSAMPINLNELDGLMPALPTGGALELGEGEDESPESIERAKVDKEITGLIEKQPEEVASLLRSWLADRRS